MGLGDAGWNGIFAIEKDPMAYESFDRNLVAEKAPHRHFKNWPQWLSRSSHSIEDILEDPVALDNLSKMRGRVTLVAGGPPCQGFSVAGARNGEDPRNLLVFKQIKLVSILKPKFCIIENVEGFERKFISRPIDKINISVAEAALREISKLGYSVGKVTINAADYGVPQIRKRVILFAMDEDFFGPLNASKILQDVMLNVGIEQRISLNLPTKRYVTVGEAISDLSGDNVVADPEFEGYRTCQYLPAMSAYEKLMRKNIAPHELPSSHRFSKHSSRAVELYKRAIETQPPGRLSKEFLYQNGCHSNKRFVLDVHKPCSTVTTAPEELIHFSHPRSVTLREMARIQSFPDDFRFFGRYTLNGPCRGIDVPRNAQIGNAIPPLVGRALGLSLKKILSIQQRESAAFDRYREPIQMQLFE